MIPPQQTILVTGTPRSGTTPVGDVLSTMKGAAVLYEPWGPNGDRRFEQPFAMPGEPRFGFDDLGRFVTDMKGRNLQFKPQLRKNVAPMRKVATRVFGTRALVSYRRYRFNPRIETLIWKDPFAAFAAEHGHRFGYRAILTVRPPLAHASSFKRLGWRSRAAKIYARYAAYYGPIQAVADALDQYADNSAVTAAAVWRMVYDRFLRFDLATAPNLYFLDMDALAKDELAAYRGVYDWLGFDMPATAAAKVRRRADGGADTLPDSGKVHHFNRSAAAANAYWRDVLSDEEVALVRHLTDPVWPHLPCHNR